MSVTTVSTSNTQEKSTTLLPKVAILSLVCIAIGVFLATHREVNDNVMCESDDSATNVDSVDAEQEVLHGKRSKKKSSDKAPSDKKKKRSGKQRSGVKKSQKCRLRKRKGKKAERKALEQFAELEQEIKEQPILLVLFFVLCSFVMNACCCCMWRKDVNDPLRMYYSITRLEQTNGLMYGCFCGECCCASCCSAYKRLVKQRYVESAGGSWGVPECGNGFCCWLCCGECGLRCAIVANAFATCGALTGNVCGLCVTLCLMPPAILLNLPLAACQVACTVGCCGMVNFNLCYPGCSWLFWNALCGCNENTLTDAKLLERAKELSKPKAKIQASQVETPSTQNAGESPKPSAQEENLAGMG